MYAITKSFVLSIISIYHLRVFQRNKWIGNNFYVVYAGTDDVGCHISVWNIRSYRPRAIFQHSVFLPADVLHKLGYQSHPLQHHVFQVPEQWTCVMTFLKLYISSTGFGTDSGECSVAGNLCLTDEGPRPRATPPPPGATPTRTAADSFVWLHLFSDFQTVYRIKLKIIIKAGRKSYKVGNKGNKLLNVAHIKVS